MRLPYMFLLVGTALLLAPACKAKRPDDNQTPPAVSTASNGGRAASTTPQEDFEHTTGDRFGDSAILRYRVPGFDGLAPKTKILLYYLAEAALSGRDIAYDQKYRYNLAIRRTVEAIIEGGKVNLKSAVGQKLVRYAKQIWFASGIHHDYSSDKFVPEFDYEWFAGAVKALPDAALPLSPGQKKKDLLAQLKGPMFDPKIDAKGVQKAADKDPIKDSANNFYAPDVTAQEVEAFYAAMKRKGDERPISYGLNSKVVKEDGKLREKVWKVGGMYGPAIEKIVFWLEKAAGVAENDAQKAALEQLVKYYKSGDLADFDTYNIAWVKDTASTVDVINGFIEVYGDALAYKGMFESVVNFRDPVATRRIAALAKEAQWFEDNAPYLPEHKKKEVRGISAKVINVVIESGDAAPTTPIGINLPNANWIRAEHGSKSVTIGNIIEAYGEARSAGGTTEEFSFSAEIAARLKEHGGLARDLKVDLHEVIGHASGQLEEDVGTPKETLKTYSSTLEEGRADLVALYFVLDPKLVELGLVPNDEVGKAGYDTYINNGLMQQLNRIKPGNDLEEAHMRNRQMISAWALEKGKKDNVIERKVKGGKTYFVVNDYQKLRALFGALLKEVQRIKSQGDYEAGKRLVETYGVKVDTKLHDEVLARYKALDMPSYYGFIQPRLTPVEKDGKLVDVKISYPTDFMAQQLRYSKAYSFLPASN